jgi:hypothetical protein
MSLRFRIILGSIGLAVFAAYLVVQFGFDLVRDVSIRGQPTTIHRHAKIVNAECTRYYLALSARTITYANRRATHERATHFKDRNQLHYLVVGAVAGEPVVLLQPRSKPEIVASTLACGISAIVS